MTAVAACSSSDPDPDATDPTNGKNDGGPNGADGDIDPTNEGGTGEPATCTMDAPANETLEEKRLGNKLPGKSVAFATELLAGTAFDVFEKTFAEELCKNGIAGAVVFEDVDERETFGSAVFEMSHVDVSAAAVEEETTVAGRFIPIALMHVGKAVARAVENPIADAPHGAGRSGGVGGETAVFSLEADDAIHTALKIQQREAEAKRVRCLFGSRRGQIKRGR